LFFKKKLSSFHRQDINSDEFLKSINDEEIMNLLREIDEVEPELRKMSELASQPITNVPPDLMKMLHEELKESVQLGIQDAELEISQKQQELNEELKRQFERSKKKYTKGL
jgi:antitoxin component of MazEF toxin-antitoxin module